MPIRPVAVNGAGAQECRPSLARAMWLAEVPVIEFELDADGRLVLRDANPAAEDARLVDRADQIGLAIEEAYPALTADEVGRAKRVAAGGGVYSSSVARGPQHGIVGERIYHASLFQTAPNWAACVFADVGERVHAEQVLTQLVRASSAANGPDLMRDLTQCLSQALSADAVFVGEIVREAPHQMAAIALAIEGATTDGVVFEIDRSPCGDVLERDICCVHSGASEQYGDDVLIQVAQCEAFVGVPLQGSDGQALGVMAALFCRPLDEPEAIASVLRIVAPRVAGEIERTRVEEALRESEHRFRTLIQNSSDVTAVIDYSGVIQFESPSATRVLGYEPGGLVGKSGLELLHPDDLAPMQARLVDLARREGSKKPVEVRLRHHDGSWVYVEIMGENLLHDPAIKGFLLTCRDVTERREAEHARMESDDRVRSFFQVPMVGAAIWLADGRCAEANSRLCEMLGYRQDELIGAPWQRFTHPDDVEAERQVLEDARGVEFGSMTREKRYVRKDGSILNARVYTGRVRGVGGAADHYVSVVEDLGEQRWLAQELRASEQRYRQVVLASNDWVWEVDADGRYTYSSGHVADLLGYDPSEIIGVCCMDLMPPEEGNRVRAVHTDHTRSHEPFRGFVNLVRHKDGHLVTLVTNGVPFFDQDGRLAGYRGTNRLAP